jgi:hypothetical protein
MWKFNIINHNYCNKTGNLLGVTLQVDNGDTQYLTVKEYNKFIKNRKEKYGERDTVPLDENQKRN